MVKVKNYILSILIFGSLSQLNIVSQQPDVLDGIKVPEHVPNRVIQYNHLGRNQDPIIWSKTVYRTIDRIYLENYFWFYSDTNNTGNLSFYEIIRESALTKDEIILFEAHLTSIVLQSPLLKNSVEHDLDYKERVESLFNLKELKVDSIFDSINGKNEIDYVQYNIPYKSSDIIKYEIVEEWYFDKVNSIMDVKIIALSPVVCDMSNSNCPAEKNLFWIDFQNYQDIFKNHYLIKNELTGEKNTINDLFFKRNFKTYINKDTNISSRLNFSNRFGISSILEFENIKLEMNKLELLIWDI
jgi:hypothetical protein